MATYGTEIRTRRELRDEIPLDLIGEVSRSHAGNTIIRVGREIAAADPRWEKVAHLALTPRETDDLIGEMGGFTRAQLLACLTGSGADAYEWLANLIGADDEEIDAAKAAIA